MFSAAVLEHFLHIVQNTAAFNSSSASPSYREEVNVCQGPAEDTGPWLLTCKGAGR